MPDQNVDKRVDLAHDGINQVKDILKERNFGCVQKFLNSQEKKTLRAKRELLKIKKRGFKSGFRKERSDVC